MLKNKFLPILLIATSGFSYLVSCDEISMEDRLIEKDNSPLPDNSKDSLDLDSISDGLPIVVSRNVLIEDFTGQKCTNCPKATEAIDEIIEAYGDSRVFPVAIHCGRFGIEGVSGLVTPFGKEYWEKWFTDTQNQPIGMVNRGASCEFASWGDEAIKILSLESSVDLSCTITYDAVSREAVVATSCLATVGYEAYLQLWVIEDSIVAVQAQPDGSLKRDYVHNHVLRDAINGSWGEKVTFAEAQATWSHAYNLPEKYVAENSYVLAFIYDDSGVQQVCKASFVTFE